jgi:hypothetical protein
MKSCFSLRHVNSRLAEVIFVLFFIPVTLVTGQQVRNQKQVPPLKDRLFFGGNIGLQFGTYTNIDISPIVGLWVLPRLAVAAGPSYTFYKDPYGKTMIFGGKAYTEIVFLQDLNNLLPIGIHMGLFLHGEWEGLSLESAYFKAPPDDSGRFWINTFLGGGGIRQQLGPRSAMDITFLWAFNDSGYYVYGNPEIRVSFMF